MEVILVFEIKSYKGTYRVDQVNDFTIHHESNDVVVVDEYILNQYYGDFLFSCPVYAVNVSEESKTLEQTKSLIDFLIESGFNKSNKIIAIGGGVVQDLVSFTSSILYRGVDWEFYPTTLLAQSDSCIGSKTSINYMNFKNLLGGFHPPRRIRINKEFLKTLPQSEIKSGVGEMLHYFILNHNIKLAKRMVTDTNILSNMDYYVSESLAIKKKMIEVDEFDKHQRNLFNYGHTFGHAIESISNYGVNHGQAVTRGMRIANAISFQNNLINKFLYNELEEVLKLNDTDFEINDIDGYIEALKRDKKNVDNKLTCILLNQDYAIKDRIFYEQVRNVLNECF